MAHQNEPISTLNAVNRATPDTATSPPAKRVTPFPRSQIEPVSREGAALGNRLLDLLPTAHEGAPLLDALGAFLGEVVGRRHSLYFHGMRSHHPDRVAVELGDAFVTWFALPPARGRGLLVCDMNLVECWIEGLLGERLDLPRRIKALGPQDFGLATYVLLRATSWLGKRGLPPLVLPSGSSSRGLISSVLQEGRLIEVVYLAFTDQSAGSIRLFLPPKILQNLDLVARSPGTQNRVYASDGRRWLTEIPVSLPVSLALLPTDHSALAQLKPGDVILLKEHGLCAGGFEGRSSRVYLNKGGEHLCCKLGEAGSGRWQAELLEITPLGDNPQDENEPMNQDPHINDIAEAKTSHLASAVEVSLDVRVGNLTLSVHEISRLQAGKVLELDRDIGDLVDLVVNNRVIGRGELVSIEGRLGVRVRVMGRTRQ